MHPRPASCMRLRLMGSVQVEEPTSARRQVWNIMKSPSSDTDPTAYAVNLAHNVRYHEAVGYAGNLAIVTFNDVLGLLANPMVRQLQDTALLPDAVCMHRAYT